MKFVYFISTTFLLLLACTNSTKSPEGYKLKKVDLNKVKVGGEIGRRIDITINNNLLCLNVDSGFIEPFQKRETSKYFGGYIGIGKLIDASVRLAYYTGNDSVIKFKNHLISELIKTQMPDGYIGIMQPEGRIWDLWDIHEMGYIINGFCSDYMYFKGSNSLESAKKLANYLISRLKAETKHPIGKDMLNYIMPITGLEENFLALYNITKDVNYLNFVKKFRDIENWKPMFVLGRYGKIDGQVYASISRSLAQLRLNNVSPNTQLEKPALSIVDFLINKNGLAITGECDDAECFHNSQEGIVNLGETCSSAYFIRLLEELMRNDPKPMYGDLMERVIYNGLFAAQSPNGRNIRYYTAFDGVRNYWDKPTFCCPNNYRRIISELPCMVYYVQNNDITLNLYTSSTANVVLANGVDLKINQETNYPSTGKILVNINPSKEYEFGVNLRIPLWCKENTVKINGTIVKKTQTKNNYLSLKRKWKSGDKIEIDLSMPIRFVKGRVAQADRVAIMRGSVVYCLDRKSNPDLTGVDLRTIIIDPATVEGPFNNKSVRPAGTALKVKAWLGTQNWPFDEYKYNLTLTEFPNENGEAIYFKVPNPASSLFADDELIR